MSATVLAMGSVGTPKRQGRPTGAPKWQGIERRAYRRWQGGEPQPLAVRIDGHTLACGVSNISAGGALLLVDTAMPLGSAAVLEINADVHLKGQLVRHDGATFALRFELPPMIAAQIDSAVGAGLPPTEW